jgi:hypothetical protein
VTTRLELESHDLSHDCSNEYAYLQAEQDLKSRFIHGRETLCRITTWVKRKRWCWLHALSLPTMNMDEPKSVHEPNAPLLSAQDAIQDAERLRELLRRNRQQAEQEVQLRVPFTVILEAIDQLEAGELRLLVQRLEDRLAAVQS